MGNDKDVNKASPISDGVTRRDFLRLGAAGVAAGLAGWRTSAWAAGSGTPGEEGGKNRVFPLPPLPPGAARPRAPGAGPPAGDPGGGPRRPQTQEIAARDATRNR